MQYTPQDRRGENWVSFQNEQKLRFIGHAGKEFNFTAQLIDFPTHIFSVLTVQTVIYVKRY